MRVLYLSQYRIVTVNRIRNNVMLSFPRKGGDQVHFLEFSDR